MCLVALLPACPSPSEPVVPPLPPRHLPQTTLLPLPGRALLLSVRLPELQHASWYLPALRQQQPLPSLLCQLLLLPGKFLQQGAPLLLPSPLPAVLLTPMVPAPQLALPVPPLPLHQAALVLPLPLSQLELHHAVAPAPGA